MCLAVIAFQVADDAPVFVAANREEHYARPSSPPHKHGADPPSLFGVDLQAGGTWLGVNRFGVVVGLTNRTDAPELPARRSRGLLCVDLLAQPSSVAVVEAARRELTRFEYAGCNLFCVDRKCAHVVHWNGDLHVTPLPAGVHILAKGNVNDESDPRIRRAHAFLADDANAELSHWIDRSRELCSLHGEQGAPICLHGQTLGTVSSTILALGDRDEQARYLHSNGPPCTTAYDDVSHVLREQVLVG